MDMSISYGVFIPRAVGLIRSMLSFEKSIVKDSKDTGADAEDSFFAVMDEAFAGTDTLPLNDFLLRLEGCKILDDRELQAAKHLLHGPQVDEVKVEESKTQIWSLIKNMRR